MIILRIIFLAGIVLCSASAWAVQGDELTQAAEKYFRTMVRQNGFNGLVLVAQGENILLRKAIGVADYELNVPLSIDHIFRIGSLSKPVTASAILHAVEASDLSLDDNLCKYLSQCPSAWLPVNLRHLITHGSGIPDMFGDLESVPVAETASELERVVEALEGNGELLDEPGAHYTYSNFNYVLLAYALEQATGRLWEEYLVTEIFEPLELTSLRFDDVYSIVPNRAHGYRRSDDGTILNIEYDDHAAYAAGGLRGTIDDFYSWFRALKDGRILQTELLDAAFAINLGYGYGWRIRDDFFDGRVENHTGGIDGFSTHIAHYPVEDLTIIVFTNIENDSAILTACDLAAIFLEWKTPPTGTKSWITDRQPRQRCGIAP